MDIFATLDNLLQTAYTALRTLFNNIKGYDMPVWMQTVLLVALVGVIALFGLKQGRRRIPSNLQRSNDYRNRYFSSKKGKGILGTGFFVCPYCGKLMKNKKKIEIDHIHSVKKVQNSTFLKKSIRKREDGVNDLKNLVHSCSRCNKRKGQKGGLWVFFGRFGKYFMFPVRLAMTAAIIFVLYRFLYINQLL